MTDTPKGFEVGSAVKPDTWLGVNMFTMKVYVVPVPEQVEERNGKHILPGDSWRQDVKSDEHGRLFISSEPYEGPPIAATVEQYLGNPLVKT